MIISGPDRNSDRSEAAPYPHHRRRQFLFLDGIRGIAAILVVLNHYASAFIPVFVRSAGTPHYTWEKPLASSPMFFLVDGHLAVYVFFLTSAVVLSQSYLSLPSSRLSCLGLAGTVVGQVVKRVVRLFLPASASFILALALLLLLPQSRIWVMSDLQSIWAARLYANPLTFGSLAKDLALNVTVLGYKGASPFDFIDKWMTGALLSPVTMAMNPPLWTLSGEFWGSMLVLLMTQLYRSLARPWFWTAFGAAFIVTGTSQFTLFLLGFAAFLAFRGHRTPRFRALPLIGTLLIAATILLDGRVNSFPCDAILMAARNISLLNAPLPLLLQAEVTAILLMLGILLTPKARHMLTSSWALWLGRHSFALYLVHFPLLFTVDFAFFALIRPSLPYAAAAALSTVAGIAVSLAAAVLFERWIDRPARQMGAQLAAGDWMPRPSLQTAD